MMKPLSVGNVVSAGLRIYRHNFGKYFRIAFLGYLWMFAPIVIFTVAVAAIASTIIGQNSGSIGLYVLILVVGIVALAYSSARFSAMSGLLARLAYKEVNEQPETVAEASRHTKPRMWNFWIAGILNALILFAAGIAISIVLSIASAIIGAIAGQDGLTLSVIAMVVMVIIAILCLLQLVGRLFLFELPLAVEDNVKAGGSIGKSWEISKGAVGRIQLILFVSFLITIPLFIVTNIISSIAQAIIGGVLGNISPELASVALIVLFVASGLISGSIMIPYWQSIKAVIYHDLKVRREGMGLDLRK